MNFYIVRSRHAAKNRFLEINAAERPEKLPLASKASHAAAGAVTRKRPPTAAMRRMAARQSRFSRRAKHAYGTANLNGSRAQEPWPRFYGASRLAACRLTTLQREQNAQHGRAPKKEGPPRPLPFLSGESIWMANRLQIPLMSRKHDGMLRLPPRLRRGFSSHAALPPRHARRRFFRAFHNTAAHALWAAGPYFVPARRHAGSHEDPVYCSNASGLFCTKARARRANGLA